MGLPKEAGRVYVVMGGQYGSEGKGEFTAYLTQSSGAKHVVRTGGPNAGHTVTSQYGLFKMRQIPTPWMVPIGEQRRPPNLYVGAGSLINPDIVIKEIHTIGEICNRHGLCLPSIYIDEQAVVIEERHVNEEHSLLMRDSIGSTTEGIGAARASHIMRDRQLEFARDRWYTGEELVYSQEFGQYGWETGRRQIPFFPKMPTIEVCNVSEMLESAIHVAHEDVIVESTQGFGLSLVHSKHLSLIHISEPTRPY